MEQKTKTKLLDEIAALRTRIAWLEDRLCDAQQMETVGRLAGGVAHDFNNLLMAILGCSELLLERLGEHDRASQELAKDIQKAGVSATELTRQLLAFSRKRVPQPTHLNLNAVVSNLRKMLRRLLREDIRLVTVLDPTLGPVHADPGQLEQVIFTLVVNARDAMPTGGTLTITTRSVTKHRDRPSGVGSSTPDPQSSAPEKWIELSVTDTGPGMTEELCQQLSELYFPDKKRGKGVGLGLATAHGIVTQGGGQITLENEVGRGRVIRIRLPQVEEPTKVFQPLTDLTVPTRHGETILLAEDDPAVRKVIREILANQGYTVLEAQDGQEAIGLAEQLTGPIHVLLADVMMPEMGGRALADRLTPQHPGMKVLFMTAHPEDAIVHHGVLDAGIALIRKPFTPTALTRKIREVLEG
jgi:nitrogen-specific signal transduction histidine kinase